MAFNFDEIIERRGTMSIKYDMADEQSGGKNFSALWIADMDFRCPPAVTGALRERVEHGIFGYTKPDTNYFEVLSNWFARRFNWRLNNEDHLITSLGVLSTVCTAIRALTMPGDAVIIQSPVYHNFRIAITENKRRAVYNPLIFKDGRYELDFEDFEKKIKDNNVKLYILCSPHNPIARVWPAADLERLGDICLKHGVTVLSDEIFMDFVFGGARHTVFASIKPAFEQNSITATSPTKTFNISGLPHANIFIANDDIREAISDEMNYGGYVRPGPLSLAAGIAGYSGGEEWLTELRQYLEGNIAFLRNFLRGRLPRVKMSEVQGTYLAWLDFRAQEPLIDGFDSYALKEAGVMLVNGIAFGREGDGFQRLNFACPRAELEKALVKLERTIKGIK